MNHLNDVCTNIYTYIHIYVSVSVYVYVYVYVSVSVSVYVYVSMQEPIYHLDVFHHFFGKNKKRE